MIAKLWRRMRRNADVKFRSAEPGRLPLSGVDRRSERDRPIRYTNATLAARQVWEHHRIRDEARHLSLVSPMARAFLQWAVDHAIGCEPLSLRFIVPEAERDRLAEPLRDVRERWEAFQREPLGVEDETLAELASRALWTALVDGDSFIVPYRRAERVRYQIYQGDALAESETSRSAPNRALGIEVNDRGRPRAFYFGEGSGVYSSYAYTLPWTSQQVMRIPAGRVWHVRDRRKGGGELRGTSWFTSALDDIARLDNFHEAFIRAAIARASVFVALHQDPELTAGALAAGAMPWESPGSDDGRTDGRKPYQRMADDAGRFLTLDPGYTATSIATGAPSPTEAATIAQIERRACAGLGVSPTTLLGDYSAVSYSAGQLLRHQEAATITGLQYLVRRCIVRRIYDAFLSDAWIDLLMRWPMLMPDDRALFAAAYQVLPRYQVLDIAKTIPSVVEAFEAGLIDLVEARGALGYTTADPAAFEAAMGEMREAMRQSRGSEPDEDEPDEDEDEDRDR